MVFVNFTYTMKTRFQQHMTKVIRTVLVYFSGMFLFLITVFDMLVQYSLSYKKIYL